MKVRHAMAALFVVLVAPLVRAEEPAPGPPMTPMEQHMKEMHGSMSRLQKTTDPAKHRELMQEHMAQMRDAMETMHGMMGMGSSGMMMGGGMHGRHPPSASQKPLQDQLGELRQQQSEMQMMMEQMLQHQEQMMKQ